MMKPRAEKLNAALMARKPGAHADPRRPSRSKQKVTLRQSMKELQGYPQR